MEMPEHEPDGIVLVRRARARLPELRVIVLSRYEDMEHIDAALSAGAHAYIAKTAAPRQIRAAIRQAARSLMSDPLVVLSTTQEASVASPLTPKELTIVELMTNGSPVAEMARILWVTQDAVASRVEAIRHKLEVAGADGQRRASVPDGRTADPAFLAAL
jgi:DNA-binding NarL/FixJ family response regulator